AGPGLGLFGVAAGVVAFGLGGGQVAGGLGADLRDLPFHAGGAQLGVQRLGQRLGDRLQPVDQLPRPGQLPGQARRGAAPHPDVAGGALALAVVVPAVPERPPRPVALGTGRPQYAHGRVPPPSPPDPAVSSITPANSTSPPPRRRPTPT